MQSCPYFFSASSIDDFDQKVFDQNLYKNSISLSIRHELRDLIRGKTVSAREPLISLNCGKQMRMEVKLDVSRKNHKHLPLLICKEILDSLPVANSFRITLTL